VHLDLLKSPHGTPYQFSLWAGIWRRDVMRRFVVPGETAQELEMRGSARVTDDVLVLGTRQGPLRHGNIYRSGRGSEPAYEENGWRVPSAEVEYMRGAMTLDGLQSEVSTKIDAGWCPLGGPFYDPTSKRFVQAVVRYL
jgi:hypothetical protein